jgi:hypothetical protein
MTPLEWPSNRHHRHQRHQHLSFNGLRLTQVPLPSSPCSSPPSALINGDEGGDGWVTQIPAHTSPPNHQKHRGFSCQKAQRWRW